MLPRGWRDRLIRISNPNAVGITGLCLEIHELAISKCVAGREKDLEFIRELAKHRLTAQATLIERLRQTKVSAEMRILVRGRIDRDFPGAARAASKK